MSKLMNVIKNVWFKRGIAMISVLYAMFLGFIAYMSFGYCFEYVNGMSIFSFYLFINLISLIVMLYTRKQIITRIISMFLAPLVFTIVIFGFGNWYIIIPPFVVATIAFFAVKNGETLKTVMGTVYLLMYVLGVLAYIVANIFFGSLSFTNVELSQRSYELLSPDEMYRLVAYDENKESSHRISYYIEDVSADINLGLIKFKKVFGCIWVIRSPYEKPPHIEWKNQHTLMVDNMEFEFSFETEDNADTDRTSSTISR